ncbi:unnamed protein product [Caenorhabditis bovis]|uniref:STAS domain-containing protein n=1 Tax=Caenorhabditis bovis TaxID=2654633 RepID=A0A8S1EJC6_9PELO|nr:unnamed protein product [Caenorhabditis bovis]
MDAVAGFTVGIYNVPQAMSYSTLAGLPPVYGLYASIFPPLIYALFGTSRHTSIGVFSLTCMMINKCIQRITHNSAKYTKIEIATSLCLLTGLIQFVMALTRCDKMMKFLSAPAISAITFSACFYAMITQIPKMLGVSVPSRQSEWFNIYYETVEICKALPETNAITLAISLSTMCFLLTMKTFLEPLLRKTWFKKFPFPTELITIIVNTCLSYFLNFENNYKVQILNDIPRGFPEPDTPSISLWPSIVLDALSLSIVAYAVTMSMGQMFSKKHKYRVDSNQELLALGIVNISSSFFSTFPTSASLSRTLLNEECGAQSQLSGVVASVCILFVITFIGPLLSSLPTCVLSVIVTVAVRSLLLNICDLPKLWKYSKHDFFIWLFTAIVTLCSDIVEGVAAGILLAVITIAIQSQQPTIKQLGQVQFNDFKPLLHYSSAKPTSFKIIRFDAPLIFTNVDKFLDNVKDVSATLRIDNGKDIEFPWTSIIFDCHTWTYTDSMGIDAIQEINDELKSNKIIPMFANLKTSLRRQYEHAGLMKLIEPNQIYPSIQDALDCAHQIVNQLNNTEDSSKI